MSTPSPKDALFPTVRLDGRLQAGPPRVEHRGRSDTSATPCGARPGRALQCVALVSGARATGTDPHAARSLCPSRSVALSLPVFSFTFVLSRFRLCLLPRLVFRRPPLALSPSLASPPSVRRHARSNYSTFLSPAAHRPRSAHPSRPLHSSVSLHHPDSALSAYAAELSRLVPFVPLHPAFLDRASRLTRP